jgi:hypothetical protein
MYDKNSSTELDCNFLLFCKPFLVMFRQLLPLVAAEVNAHEEGELIYRDAFSLFSQSSSGSYYS